MALTNRTIEFAGLYAGLAAAGLLLTACFTVPSTLGSPCVQDLDCDGAQVCEQGSCAIGIAEGSGDTSTDDTGVAEQGQLRLVHAAPDLGPVDVYLSGDTTPRVAGLGYGSASAWLAVDVGSYTVELRPAGASVEAPASVSEALVVDVDARVSAIAGGLLANDGRATDAATLRILAVREDWGTPLAGRARARIIHAGADAPSLLVDGLTGPPVSLEPFTDSASVGIPLDAAGGERIELLDADNSLLTSFTTPQFAEGDEVLVIATGLLGSLAREDDGFSLIAVGEGGLLGQIRQDPQVFTLHGARDAGNLENCTNDFEVAANFTYGGIQSAFLSPGSYTFEIFGYPSGCTGVALNPGGNASGLLQAGERYLLLLTGEQFPAPGEPALQVATFVERFSLDNADAASLRFVHGASAEQIYAGRVTNGEITPDNVYTAPIAWRSESVERSLAAGFYRIGIANAVGVPNPPQAALTPLVSFDIDAVPGVRGWGIVSGDPFPDDATDGPVQLMLVDTATPAWDVALVDPNP
jgi:hypothetical protein